MRKTIKEFFKVLLATLVPSGLTYLANSDYFFQKLIEKRIIGESFNITQTQDVLLVLGIISSVLLLSLNLFFSKMRYNKTIEQRDQLLTMNAEIMKSALKPLGFGDFDIRIFIPEHPIYYKILGLKKDVLGKKVFIIKNIQTLAKEGLTKNLQFEVQPNPQGLVGMCYEQKMICYDDDLENTNTTDYNLDNNQISRTSDLKWSICCPVFNNSEDIVAILALDGKTRMKIEKSQEKAIYDNLVCFSRLLFDASPNLFKR